MNQVCIGIKPACRNIAYITKPVSDWFLCLSFTFEQIEHSDISKSLISTLSLLLEHRKDTLVRLSQQFSLNARLLLYSMKPLSALCVLQ